MAVCPGVSLAPAGASLGRGRVAVCPGVSLVPAHASLDLRGGHIAVCPGVSLAPAVASPVVAEGIWRCVRALAWLLALLLVSWSRACGSVSGR